MNERETESQKKLKEYLSDIDELVINEKGHGIAQYYCYTSDIRIPCPSLSLALGCAKRALEDGESKFVIEKISKETD